MSVSSNASADFKQRKHKRKIKSKWDGITFKSIQLLKHILSASPL